MMMTAKSLRLSLALALSAPLMLAACSDEASDAATTGAALAPIDPPAGTSWTETITVSSEGGYVMGNPAAPIKLIEYASHTCGACANFAQTGKPTLKNKYVASGVVSFEQREVFLNFYDVVIATLVQCGPKEQMQALSDEVWQNHSEVMGNIQANQQATEAAAQLPKNQQFVFVAEATGLLDFFAARGLSKDQARACLADADKIEATAKSVEAVSKAAGVTGTPTFVLNGKKLDVNSWAGVEPLLQRAGAR